MSKIKTARPAMIPQSEKMIAPNKVDTLRQERTCPVCGEQGMENGVCSVCEFVEEPEGFDDPDLTKAVDLDQQQQQQGQGVTPNQPTPQGVPTPIQTAPPSQQQGLPMAANTTTSGSNNHVKSEMSEWRVIPRRTASGKNSGGRINTQERPILPVTRQNTDKPLRPRTVSDSKAPVESNTKENNMSAKARKTADGTGATPAGSGVAADKRVDVKGVGAVDDSPEKGVKHEDVAKKVDITGTPTDTWHGDEGDSLGQQDGVTTENSDGLGGPIGQPVSNTHTGESVTPAGEAPHGSFPDHDPDRVDLTAPIAEPVGDRTMTWGDDAMHVGDPITQQDGNEVGGPMGDPLSQQPAATKSSMRDHIFLAMKIAEVEVELGITDPDAKFPRAAELEAQSPEALAAINGTLSKVKTAGLGRTHVAKTAARMPSLQHVASVDPYAHEASVNEDDAGLFL